MKQNRRIATNAYWTLPEALRWMDTRCLPNVEIKAQNPLDVAASCATPYSSSRELLTKVRQRSVKMEGIRADQSKTRYEPIDPDEVPDLYPVYDHLIEANERTGEERVIEIDAPYGLWSRSSDSLVWKTMRFSQHDVMKEWPAEARGEVDDAEPPASTGQSGEGISDTKRSRHPPVSNEDLNEFCKNHIHKQREANSVPTQNALYEAAEHHFRRTNRVTRQRIREIHRELLPDAKQGRRKNAKQPLCQ